MRDEGDRGAGRADRRRRPPGAGPRDHARRVEPRRPPRRGARRCSPRCPSRARPALRVGLTGTPGVGKSSFVESLGLMLTGARPAARGARRRSLVGALGRLDPRRQDPHGAAGPRARSPSSARRPSQAALGGVARRTRETIRLVEAWGAEVVLVETVGVGQSETMVAEMTDVFVLLIAPGGGDELQGVKRGIMEMADLILVNKADGEHLRRGGPHPRRLRRRAAPAAPAPGRPAGLAAGADRLGADRRRAAPRPGRRSRRWPRRGRRAAPGRRGAARRRWPGSAGWSSRG